MEAHLETKGFNHDCAVGPGQMTTLEAIFREWSQALGLGKFLEPIGGTDLVLYDLIYVACNTQSRWGTLRNLSLLPRFSLAPAQRDLAEQLSRLADLIAYVARTPQEAAGQPPVRPGPHSFTHQWITHSLFFTSSGWGASVSWTT